MAIAEFFRRFALTQLGKAQETQSEAAKKLYEEAAHLSAQGDLKGAREKADLAAQHGDKFETITNNLDIFVNQYSHEITETIYQRFGIEDLPVEVLSTILSPDFLQPKDESKTQNKHPKPSVPCKERKKEKGSDQDLSSGQFRAILIALALNRGDDISSSMGSRIRKSYEEDIRKKAAEKGVSLDEAARLVESSAEYAWNEARRKLKINLSKMNLATFPITDEQLKIVSSLPRIRNLLVLINEQDGEKLEEVKKILRGSRGRPRKKPIKEVLIVEPESSEEDDSLTSEELYLVGQLLKAEWFENAGDYEFVLTELKQRSMSDIQLDPQLKKRISEKLLAFNGNHDEDEVVRYSERYDEFGQVILSVINGRTNEEISSLFSGKA